MAFKALLIFGVFAVVTAGGIPVQHHELGHEHHRVVYHTAPDSHPLHLQKHHVTHEEYPSDPHPQYNFSYDVQDSLSGDSKSQSESRDGDVVKGEYSLNDADGFRRTVKYTADSVNGFSAVVHREPLVHKVVAAATPVQYHHAPETYATSADVYAHPAHAHREQHAAYTTYQVPQNHDEHHHDAHQYDANQHQHQYYHH